MLYSTMYNSPVGMLTLAGDEANLVGLWFDGQKYYGGSVSAEMTVKDDMPIFDMVRKWLYRYFAGENPAASEVPLAPYGTLFRQRIWNVLREIPYGEVISYGEIARKVAADDIKARALSRAVGGAVGHNPISIIIPCHRVVGSDGSLTGYAGGIDKKLFLLRLEGAPVSEK